MEHNSHWIIKNLIGAAVVVLVIVLVAQITLGLVTLHGKSVVVPDLSGLSVSEAALTAESFGLKVSVEDSVYALKIPKGAVFAQIPKAGAEVKKDRTIDLTINAFGDKKVSMPSLVGFSLKQARTELYSKGLTLGRIIYQADIATNVVLRQQIRGIDVKPGEQISAGSVVNLVCGLNYEEGMVYVPNVTGLNYKTAVNLIYDNSLNLGELKFDRKVRTYNDSLACIVTAQNPTAESESVLMGSEVNLVLTLPKEN